MYSAARSCDYYTKLASEMAICMYIRTTEYSRIPLFRTSEIRASRFVLCSCGIKSGSGLETRLRLRSTQQHRYALPRLPEIYRMPPKYGTLYNSDTQRYVRNRGVPLYSQLSRFINTICQICVTML